MKTLKNIIDEFVPNEKERSTLYKFANIVVDYCIAKIKERGDGAEQIRVIANRVAIAKVEILDVTQVLSKKQSAPAIENHEKYIKEAIHGEALAIADDKNKKTTDKG